MTHLPELPPDNHQPYDEGGSETNLQPDSAAQPHAPEKDPDFSFELKDPIAVATKNHDETQTEIIDLAGQLSPDQTVQQQFATIKQINTLLLNSHNTNIQNLVKLYVSQYNRDLAIQLSYGLFRSNCSKVLEVCSSIAPHAVSKELSLTEQEISENIREMYDESFGDYYDQDEGGKRFARTVSEAIINSFNTCINTVFQEIPAADSDPLAERAQAPGSQLIVLQEQGSAPRKIAQSIGKLAAQTLSIAGGVALGIIAADRLKK